MNNPDVPPWEEPPMRFIGERIEPHFDQTPVRQKMQGCPDGFLWREETFRVEALLAEWHAYDRRGRMKHNMRPEHAASARRKGSWGVGRDYFRVRTTGGRIFELYYDRAPGAGHRRKGTWMLYREWQEVPE